MKVTQLCPTLCDPMDCNSPGQNAGVVSLSILQGIFPTQGSNLCLLHYRQILYHLSHQITVTIKQILNVKCHFHICD